MEGGFGLLGRKLGHSFSPAIHRELGGYDYRLIELEEAELGPFLREGAFLGLNVTIPYKQAVIPYLDRLSSRAARVGAVNTIVRERQGGLAGYNTDWGGFEAMLRRAGIGVRGRKCLVLGNGGASKTVVCCLEELGAREIRVISRRGEDNYDNLSRHADAEVIVNATPVGMFPGNGASPVSLDMFPRLEGVADLIYNPSKTALLLQAEARGLRRTNGLYMLAEQARLACGLFLGKDPDPAVTERITEKLAREAENIVLIGMPGSGKTTVGKLLAGKTGKVFLDTDAEISRRAGGIACGDLIRRDGEDAFRKAESEVIREMGARTGCVIATGGGAVTRPENRDPLRQNGPVICLDRPPETLVADASRPLTENRELLEKKYRERKPLYESWQELAVNEGSAEAAAERILAWLESGKLNLNGGIGR